MAATTGIAEKPTGPCSPEAPCAYAREGSTCTFCWVIRPKPHPETSGARTESGQGHRESREERDTPLRSGRAMAARVNHSSGRRRTGLCMACVIQHDLLRPRLPHA